MKWLTFEGAEKEIYTGDWITTVGRTSEAKGTFTDTNREDHSSVIEIHQHPSVWLNRGSPVPNMEPIV